MQIEELNIYTKLFDVYGNLLSKKQFQVMDMFLNFGFGETEIAEQSGESRQSVHDAITKAKKQLLDFESKCGIINLHDNVKNKLTAVKSFLQDSNKANNLVDDIINLL